MKLLFLMIGPGKIRTGVRYDGPESIDKAMVVQHDLTKPIKNMPERLEGRGSMMKNHTPRRFMTKKMIDYMTEVIRETVIAHGEETPAWRLVKVITRLVETGVGFTDQDPESVKVQRFESSPQLIYKDEAGIKYKTKVQLSHGKPNRYMKAANEQYGKNSRWLQVPYTDEEDANRQKSIFAQTGCNRQGIATWGAWTQNGVITDDTSFTSTMIYNYYGLPSAGMIANEWARTGCEPALLAQLNDTAGLNNFFRWRYNVDLLTNINSRFSTHSFYNSQEFSDVNIKIYVCQARRASTGPIWLDIADFGASVTNQFKVPRYSPAAKTIGSYSDPIKATGAGFNWWNTEFAIPIDYTDNTGTGSTSSNIQVETSTVLGLTPQQSAQFNHYWEVLDVLDNTLGPNDTWDVHLDQKYGKSHSVRNWYETFDQLSLGDGGNYNNKLKATSKGDIVLLTVFSGMPASNYVLKENAKNTFAVDSGPARIRHLVRHGINISWPESLQPLDISSDDPFANVLDKEGWRVLKQKTNYTDRESYRYALGEIKVATRYDISGDDSKTQAGT